MIRLHLHHNPPSAIKGYRVCPSCKREKTTDRFYPKRTGEKRCIQCAQKGYRPPEKPKSHIGHDKRCAKCKEVKPLDDFYNAGYSYCRSCHREYDKNRMRKKRQAT